MRMERQKERQRKQENWNKRKWRMNGRIEKGDKRLIHVRAAYGEMDGI